jgi:hypothetical protein
MWFLVLIYSVVRIHFRFDFPQRFFRRACPLLASLSLEVFHWPAVRVCKFCLWAPLSLSTGLRLSFDTWFSRCPESRAADFQCLLWCPAGTRAGAWSQFNLVTVLVFISPLKQVLALETFLISSSRRSFFLSASSSACILCYFHQDAASLSTLVFLGSREAQ